MLKINDEQLNKKEEIDKSLSKADMNKLTKSASAVDTPKDEIQILRKPSSKNDFEDAK